MAGDKADILIVGAGVFGLWTARAALARGLSVRVLEAGPQPGAGASGGVVGALAPHMPDRWGEKKQFQFEALTELEPAIARLEAETELSTGYGRVGRLVPIVDEAARARAAERLGLARVHWVGRAEMSILPGDAFPRWVVPEAAPFGIVHDTLSGRLDPAATCRALAEGVRRAGGRIETGCTVTAVHAGGVDTTDGPRAGGAVVVAAGVAGFDLIAPFVGEVAGRAEKGQAALIDIDLGTLPIVHADGIYLIAHRHGRVAVGSTSERRFEDEGTDALLDDVLARAHAICPRLAMGRVVRRWAGLRPRANGRDPMLGAVPGAQGVYAALGGFKIGFGIGEKVGRTVVQEIVEGSVEMPDSFRVAAHLGL